MKKYLIALIFFLFTTETQAQAPWDIAYHAAPPSFAVNLREDIVQTAANLQSTTNQAKSILMTAKNDITNLQSAVMSTFNNISSGAILSVVGNPGQGKTTFCGKNLEKVEVNEIANKMRELFFTKKSVGTEDTNRAKEIREKFYMDNLYAIYAASLIIQQELENDIKAKIAITKSCVNGDRKACDLPEAAGENDTIFMYAKTLETLDSLIRMWESVSALKARLVAISMINDIDHAVATDANSVQGSKTSQDQSAFIIPKAHAVFSSSQTIALAQLSFKKVSSSLSAVEAANDDNKPNRLTGGTIEFTSPAPSENIHPILQLEEEFDAIDELTGVESIVSEAVETHNMIASLREYKAEAEQYVEHKKKYQKDLTRLQESEQCAIKYLNRYFSNPIKVWSGIPLGKQVYNHSLRKGISGWAYEAYEVAKAAETSNITANDMAQESIDANELNDLSDDPDLSKADKAAGKLKTSVDTSKQEKSAEEGKKSNLKLWQIGAEASKILAADPKSWGSPTNTKMIWTDTKNFYRQYLQRKYANIKSYLKVYTRNDVLALVVAKLKGKKQDISDTKYQKNLQKTSEELSQKLVANMQESKTVSQKQNSSSNSAISKLQKQRESIVAQMDKISASIRDKKNTIADIRATAEEKTFQEIDEAMNPTLVYPTSGNSGSSKVTAILGVDGMDRMHSSKISTAVDTTKIKKLENDENSDQSKLDRYKKQLEQIDEKIAIAKLEAQENKKNILDEKESIEGKIKQAIDDSIKLDAEKYASDVKKNIMPILTASAAANPLLNPVTLFAMAEKAADESLNILYKQVDAIIDSGYQQMLSLGDALYSQDSHQKIVAIHNQTLNQIRGLMLTYSVAGLIKVDSLAVYAKLATIDTSVETEGFFIGSAPKARDLKAPFAILNFDMPPVREVFRFDTDDFLNVKPLVKGKKASRAITSSDFLNFGGEIPLIWQYMLKDDAFIESKYNLKEPLSSGCEDVAFSRGGIFPCVVSGGNLVLDVNNKGEYIERSDVAAASLPKCLLIVQKNGKPYHTFWDTEVKISKPQITLSKLKQKIAKPADRNCEYSELGMLLEADENNNLSFKERAFTAYSVLAEDTDGKKINNNKKNEMASAYHAMISRNQIGDFLNQAENEKLSRDNLAEYEKKYNEQMEGLKEKLKAFGFEPSDDFDFTKEKDFALAERTLKAIKKQKMAEVKSAFAQVKYDKNNDVAQEKATNMKKLLDILQKDSEAHLNLTAISYDNNNIDADLKKAKADKAVVDKYKNSLKEQAKSYNDVDEAFCANY